ncbi:MAG: galactofuranosyltransferase [Prevotella sp.]|nr:galactofuranosyltransferase [Prevotella sp.]
MRYYIEVGTVNKAKQDIDEICCREGFTNLTRHNFGKGGMGRFLTKLVSITNILFQLKKDDILFLQYPMKKFYKTACTLAYFKSAKVVTVIHDLGAFRRHKLSPEGENRRLSKTDFLIVHNTTMRNYLIEHGFKGGIHCLQIFDYLSMSKPTNYKTPHTPWRIVYAGNLARWRNDFLYKLEPIMKNWQMDLYGKGFDASTNTCQQLFYHGFMVSDEFIAKAEADFGLVWDGDSLEQCTGDWGEYLRINDPHKTSFYLRAGIPVIVWRQAAMSPFIESQGIGIVIDGLHQLDERLMQLSNADYQQMRQNAQSISLRLNEGYYIKQGIKAAISYLSKRDPHV